MYVYSSFSHFVKIIELFTREPSGARLSCDFYDSHYLPYIFRGIDEIHFTLSCQEFSTANC